VRHVMAVCGEAALSAALCRVGGVGVYEYLAWGRRRVRAFPLVSERASKGMV